MLTTTTSGVAALGLLFVLVPGAAAQDLSAVSPPTRTLLPAPIEVELIPDAAGRPSVLVMINGTGPWRFAVDLGANALVIGDTVATAAGLAEIGVDTVTVLGRTVSVPSLEVGGARFEEMAAGVFDLPGGIQGILGFNVFNDLLITFDFPNRRFRLERDTLPVPDGVSTLALAVPDAARLAYLDIPADATTGQQGVQPHIAFAVGELSGSAVLDTQAGGYFYLPDSLKCAMSLRGDTSQLAGQGPVMGQMTLRRVRVADTLTVGAYRTVEPIVTFRDRPGPMFGMGFLGQFVLSFDQRNGRVRLTGPDDVITVPVQTWESPVEARAADLEQYVGVYGNREVTLDSGTLYLQANRCGRWCVPGRERTPGFRAEAGDGSDGAGSLLARAYSGSGNRGCARGFAGRGDSGAHTRW
jgi:hypothetical protein